MSAVGVKYISPKICERCIQLYPLNMFNLRDSRGTLDKLCKNCRNVIKRQQYKSKSKAAIEMEGFSREAQRFYLADEGKQ